MQRVIEAVNAISQINGVLVDCNYLQGQAALEAHLSGYDDLLTPQQVLEHFPEYIEELQGWVLPYQLPDDYLYFLRQYGGLLLWRNEEKYLFVITGLGPMVHTWYESPITSQDFNEFNTPFLELGHINFDWDSDGGKYVSFLLDLGGVIQKNAVVALRLWQRDPDNDVVQILQNPQRHSNVWEIVGSSFTEWLQKGYQNECTFGFFTP